MGMTRASLYKVLKVRDPTNLPKKGGLSDSGRFETTGVRGHCPPGFRDWSVASGSAVAVARSFDVPPRIRTNSAARRIRIRRPNSIEPSVSCRHSALCTQQSHRPPASSLLTSHSQCLATPTARMAPPSIPTMRTSTSTARTTSGSAARSRCSGAVTVGVCRRAKFAKLILRVRAKFKSCEFADFAVFANSPRIREAKLPDPARITALLASADCRCG